MVDLSFEEEFALKTSTKSRCPIKKNFSIGASWLYQQAYHEHDCSSNSSSRYFLATIIAWNSDHLPIHEPGHDEVSCGGPKPSSGFSSL